MQEQGNQPEAGAQPRVWSYEEEPDGVTTVVDGDGDDWVRHPDGLWYVQFQGGHQIAPKTWKDLFVSFGPLTEAPPAPPTAEQLAQALRDRAELEGAYRPDADTRQLAWWTAAELVAQMVGWPERGADR